MTEINGVCWILIRNGDVLLEKCPKKAAVLGVGEWFVPGGKTEDGEIPEETLIREIGEEWPSVRVLAALALPIVEGSAIPPGPRGLFLMRPYRVDVDGVIPECSADGVELRWTPIAEALSSPVAQVRMMIAAALPALGDALAIRDQQIAWLQESLEATSKVAVDRLVEINALGEQSRAQLRDSLGGGHD